MFNKKYFKLVIIIALLVVIAVIVTYINNRNKPQKAGSPVISNAKYIQSDPDGNYFYLFNTKDLVLQKYDTNKKSFTNLAEPLNTIPDSVIWSPDHKKAIVKIAYQKDLFLTNKVTPSPQYSVGDPTNWLFDFDTKTISILSQNIFETAWSPDSNKIVYNYVDASANSIMISNPDGTNFRKLIDIDYAIGAGINYLSNTEILYYPIVSEANSGPLHKYTLDTNQTTTITDNSSSVDVSPDGKLIYYSKYDSAKDIFLPVIYSLADSIEKPIKSQDLFVTSWSGNNKHLLATIVDKDNKIVLIESNLDGNISTLPIDVNGSIEDLILPISSDYLYIIADNNLYKTKLKQKID